MKRSSDGKTLLVSMRTDTQRLAVHRVDRATGRANQITFPPVGSVDSYATHSFDGKRILFRRLIEGRGALMLMPAEGGEPEVLGRREELERALLNLLWNGLEAQSGAPAAELLVRWGETPAGAWVEVGDRGPGLPGDMLGDLADAGRSTRGKGRGLGLNAVARTMQRHGGRLRGGAREGGGALLRLEFGLERELDFGA